MTVEPALSGAGRPGTARATPAGNDVRFVAAMSMVPVAERAADALAAARERLGERVASPQARV